MFAFTSELPNPKHSNVFSFFNNFYAGINVISEKTLQSSNSITAECYIGSGLCKEKKWDVTTAPVSIWLISAVTPGVLTTSYKWRTETSGFIFINMERGWPIPPAAPKIATLKPGAAPFARQWTRPRFELPSIPYSKSQRWKKNLKK